MSRYNTRNFIDQLLRQHEPALKEYLVCRMGGAEHLESTYAALFRRLADGSSHFEQGPSLLAAAYATARQIAFSDSTASSVKKSEIQWRPSPSHSSGRYTEALDLLRSQLNPTTAEVLELLHARGLTTGEIGYVLRATEMDIDKQVSRGSSQILQLTGAMLGVELDVRSIVQHAFRPRLTFDAGKTSDLNIQAPPYPCGDTARRPTEDHIWPYQWQCVGDLLRG